MQSDDLKELPKYLRAYFEQESQFYYYSEYEKHKKEYRKLDDVFVCLKGFSSSTPLINPVVFNNNCIGGGLYFRYKGVGIVVDPGIGFVSLMHRNGIFIDDIDIVIVTHSHIDHNCDVATLSSLLYDYNKDKSRTSKFYRKFLLCGEPKEHVIEWFLDDTTLKQTEELLSCEYVHKLSELVKSIEWKNIKEIDGITIGLQAVETDHEKNKKDTYGIKLKFEEDSNVYVWGYTSDTAYFDDLATFFEGCQVLLFNISDIYINDVREIKSKSGHLGFNGSVQLLKKACPQIALVTEFCCMNGDYRHEIVRALRERLGNSNIHILPADRGLKMSIGTKQIECTLCKTDCLVENISIARPKKEFENIHYICPDCLL